MHERIAAFITSRFRTHKGFEYDSSLFSSGIVDSFGVLELIAFLEDTFGVTIDPTIHDLAEFDTVDKIVILVERSPKTPSVR